MAKHEWRISNGIILEDKEALNYMRRKQEKIDTFIRYGNNYYLKQLKKYMTNKQIRETDEDSYDLDDKDHYDYNHLMATVENMEKLETLIEMMYEDLKEATEDDYEDDYEYWGL